MSLPAWIPISCTLSPVSNRRGNLDQLLDFTDFQLRLILQRRKPNPKPVTLSTQSRRGAIAIQDLLRVVVGLHSFSQWHRQEADFISQSLNMDGGSGG